MSWLVVGQQGIRLGEEAAELKAFLEQVSDLAERHGGDARTLLEELAAGDVDHWVDENKAELLEALAGAFLDEDLVEQVGRLRSRLDKLGDDPQAPVRVLWPHVGWTTKATPGKFRISLSAEAGAAFIVRPRNAATTEPEITAARLRFDGEVRSAADAGMRSAQGAELSAGARASLARHLAYELGYPDGLKTGHALQDALERVQPLDDFESVVRGFARGTAGPAALDAVGRPLRAIRYGGRGGLELSVGASIAVPSANYGTFTGRVSGRARVGDQFELRIEPHGRDALHVEGSLDALSGREGEVTIGYRLGLGDIPAPMARAILGQAAGVEDLLQDIDAGLDEAESWLKPGSLLRDFLEASLTGKLDGVGESVGKSIRNGLGDALGIDAEGDTLVSEAADWLARQLDDAQGTLFSGDLRAWLAGEIEEALPKLDHSATEALQEVADDLSTEIDGRLKKLEKRLNSTTRKGLKEVLDQPPSSALKGLRAFLDDSRTLLHRVAEGMREPQRDLIAAQLSWLRSEETTRSAAVDFVVERAGREFYRKLIWFPSRYATRPLDRAIAGVTADPERMQVVEESIGRRIGRWNVGVLDMFSLGGQRTTMARVRVEATPSGVTVGSRAFLERRRKALFSSDGAIRRITFADTLSFVRVAADPEAGVDGEPAVVGHLALQLIQDEPGWDKGSGEAAEFAGAFREVGLVSEQVVAKFVDIRDEAADADGTPPEAVARAILAIPTEYADDVITFACEHPELTKKIALAALYRAGVRHPWNQAQHEGNNFVNAFRKLRKSRDFLQSLPENADEQARRQFRERAVRLQREMMDPLDRLWTRTGYSGIAAPEGGVLAFFLALQALCGKAVGSRPSVVFSFQAKGAPEPRQITSRPQEWLDLDIPGNAFEFGR